MEEKEISEAVDEKRKKTFEENQGLAISVLNDFLFTHEEAKKDYDDLKQVSLLALWNCTASYDPESGYQFSTYAYTAIKNAIKNYYYENRNLIHIPYKARISIARYNSFRESYYNHHGNYPVDEEIRKELGLSQNELNQVRVDATSFRRENNESMDNSYDPTRSDPSEIASVKEIYQKIELFYSRLDEIDQYVFDTRIRNPLKTLEEIAKHYSISFEAIRKREKRLLRRLKDELNLN